MKYRKSVNLTKRESFIAHTPMLSCKPACMIGEQKRIIVNYITFFGSFSAC